MRLITDGTSPTRIHPQINLSAWRFKLQQEIETLEGEIDELTGDAWYAIDMDDQETHDRLMVEVAELQAQITATENELKANEQ